MSRRGFCKTTLIDFLHTTILQKRQITLLKKLCRREVGAVSFDARWRQTTSGKDPCEPIFGRVHVKCIGCVVKRD